ncbi:unnamed protein product [Wuchereria bancrofti]|uniref:Uncharacterized protein n=1 Tax=Wuchereria bancrofti TaxID=6293 RepID=A0A3P7FXV6_WUCBA|nr:unnamed protein product [Wuchereria bancrofti]
MWHIYFYPVACSLQDILCIIIDNSLELFMAQVHPSPWSRWDAPG